MAKTNYTSLGINTIGKNDADIECTVIRYTPITGAERDAIANPVNGMEIYNSDTNVIDGYIAGTWPATPCGIALLSILQELSGLTSVINQNNIVVTNNGFDFSFGKYEVSNTSVNIGSGIVVTEFTINSLTESGTPRIDFIIQEDVGDTNSTGLNVAYAAIGSGTTDIQTLNPGQTIELNTTLTLPFTAQLAMNGATNKCIYQDTDGRSDILDVTGTLNGTTLKKGFFMRPDDGGGEINATINDGSEPFILTPPEGYKTWCNSQFCPPLSLSTVDLSGSQTTSIVTIASNASQITGTNLTPSVSNNTAAYESVGFTTSTDKVHIEGTFKSQTGTTGLVGIGFSDSDPFAGFSDVVTAVGALPSLNLLIDGFTGSPLATGVIMNADYAFSLDIDSSAGTSAYKDTQGNSGSLGVKSSYNNANPLFVFSSSNSGSTLNDSIVLELNAGATTDVLPTSGAVTPCQAS